MGAQGETPSPATLPRVLSLAGPAHGLGEPNPWRGKASWPARPAPNEPPRLCRTGCPRQHPPAQKSKDAPPTLPGRDRAPHALPAPGRSRTPGREDALGAQPHFPVLCPSGIRLGWLFDVAAWQTAAETGSGSRPATAIPGRGPARCPTPASGSPGPGGRRTRQCGQPRRPGDRLLPGAGDRSGPVPGTRTQRGMSGAASAAPLEAEKQPAVSVRAGAGGEAGVSPGLSHADQRRAGETIARRCQKRSSAPRGTAADRELAGVQQAGRARQNTHRTINPPAPGPRTSLRLSGARRGRFRGEGLSPAGLDPLSHSDRGRPGSDRIPGLNRPPDLRQALNSCGFAGLDGK